MPTRIMDWIPVGQMQTQALSGTAVTLDVADASGDNPVDGVLVQADGADVRYTLVAADTPDHDGSPPVGQILYDGSLPQRIPYVEGTTVIKVDAASGRVQWQCVKDNG